MSESETKELDDAEIAAWNAASDQLLAEIDGETKERSDDVGLPDSPGTWIRSDGNWEIVVRLVGESTLLYSGFSHRNTPTDGSVSGHLSCHAGGWSKAAPASPCPHCADKQAENENWSARFARLADELMAVKAEIDKRENLLHEHALIVGHLTKERDTLKLRLADVERQNEGPRGDNLTMRRQLSMEGTTPYMDQIREITNDWANEKSAKEAAEQRVEVEAVESANTELRKACEAWADWCRRTLENAGKNPLETIIVESDGKRMCDVCCHYPGVDEDQPHPYHSADCPVWLTVAALAVTTGGESPK